MKKTLLVAGQELIVNLRRPGFIIMTLIVPVLGLVVVLVGSLFGGQVGRALESQFEGTANVLGFVDQSGLLRSDLPQYAGTFVRYSDEASARADLVAKEIDTYLVIPPDYLETGRVLIYGTKGGFSTLTATEDDRLRAFLTDELLSGRVDAAIQNRASGPINFQPVTVDATGEVSTESAFSWLGDFVLPYVFSILFLITLFTTSGFLLQSVSEEKENRIIEILVSSISSTELLAGKILGLGALGLIQVVVWIGSGVALTGLATVAFALVGAIQFSTVSLALAVVYFLLGYILFATMEAVAGSLGTTQRESQQIGGIFSLAAVIPFMVIGVVMTDPNAPIAVVLSYIPFTAPVMMILRLGFGQVPAGEIAISLTLLVAGIFFCLWAGAKVFRMGLLMYGKRPSLKELALALRQA